MNFNLNLKHLSGLQKQRQFLLFLSSFLLIINFLQSFLLIFKKDRIVIVPSQLQQSFWVEGNNFSPSYLEEQALYFSHLLLDITQSNFISQAQVVLRYVDSKTYGDFKVKLLTQLERLKKDNLSLAFVAVDWQVNVDDLSVTITGDLLCYVASQRVSVNRKSYKVSFSSNKGRLFLKTFEDLEKSNQEGMNSYA
jgi:type IV conjugative transfer system protein TraE